MTFNEFSRLNRERCEASNGFGHTLDSWSLSNWFTATMGEAGEKHSGGLSEDVG